MSTLRRPAGPPAIGRRASHTHKDRCAGAGSRPSLVPRTPRMPPKPHTFDSGHPQPRGACGDLTGTHPSTHAAGITAVSASSRRRGSKNRIEASRPPLPGLQVDWPRRAFPSRSRWSWPTAWETLSPNHAADAARALTHQLAKAAISAAGLHELGCPNGVRVAAGGAPLCRPDSGHGRRTVLDTQRWPQHE